MKKDLLIMTVNNITLFNSMETRLNRQCPYLDDYDIYCDLFNLDLIPKGCEGCQNAKKQWFKE